ncbi:hypothetical protein UIB01_22785 (plasmid) [Stutzerimonas decontaminans]|uniref:Uncharacterized protein n=1 Tax=Stutzerimonas stutzeri TaxID=316 RepID=A0A023WZN2_STUST|nr:hypothetical protein UIB01_22785 [Stutzerimonas decontaminans]
MWRAVLALSVQKERQRAHRGRNKKIARPGLLFVPAKSSLDKEMTTQLEEDDLGSRLLTIPCVGPITASLLSAEMAMASSMAAAVISRHRWGWCPASTAPAVEPICWG